jgi:glycosyltransferase involved in cell wall biosynthesis
MVYLFHEDTSDIDWVQGLINEGKNIYFLSGNFSKDIFILKKILIRHNIKYIHAHFAGAKFFFLFSIVKILYDKKLFILRHLRNHDKPRGLISESLRKALNNVDLYIGCSESVALEYRKNFKLNSKKVTFVTNAIDFDRLKRFESLERVDFNINSSATVFLMFGFDYLRKGVDVVLEAMEKLVNEKHDVCLLLSLSVNRESIELMITNRFSKIPEWLKILSPRNDIASYYYLSDYFISASREEGFCNALVESAYCERPIITSDIPGPQSLNIPHTRKFTSENINELQNEMRFLMSLSDDERKKITTDQKAYVQKAFDLDTWAGQISDIYKRIGNSTNVGADENQVQLK